MGIALERVFQACLGGVNHYEKRKHTYYSYCISYTIQYTVCIKKCINFIKKLDFLIKFVYNDIL